VPSEVAVAAQNLVLQPAVPAEAGPERRRHPRLRLSYLLRLFRPGQPVAIEIKTEDLSCDGFYCISDRPVLLHERIECELLIPGEPRESDLVLCCRAEVVRVTEDPLELRFGVACRFEAYTVNRNITLVHRHLD
jgi:hypothetical protein